MHQNLRLLTFVEDYETLDEMSRIMSNIENSIMHPLRGLLRILHSMSVVSLVKDSNLESDSEDTHLPVVLQQQLGMSLHYTLGHLHI